jgi:hypothetical protein
MDSGGDAESGLTTQIENLRVNLDTTTRERGAKAGARVGADDRR